LNSTPVLLVISAGTTISINIYGVSVAEVRDFIDQLETAKEARHVALIQGQHPTTAG
jgi:hypothetical protein